MGSYLERGWQSGLRIPLLLHFAEWDPRVGRMEPWHFNPWTLYCTSLHSDCSQEYLLVCFGAAGLAAHPGWPGMISAPSGTSEALEQAGVVWSSHTTTWQAHAGSSTRSRRFHPAPPGELPKISRALVCSCLKAVTSFAVLGVQDEEGSGLSCLLHTSGTDMEPVLQTAARVPLPLEDFSKTRLPTADLQRFLEQRGDSREATNYVDEEPDSKQCLFSL